VGDMVKWSASTYCVVPVDPNGGDAASAVAAGLVLGVSNDQQPVASLGGAVPQNIINVITAGIFKFFVDDASTYYPGDTVKIGGNAQTVRKTGASAGNAVGIVAPENFFQVSASQVTGITPGVGGTILIALQAQDVLQIAGK